MGGKGEGGGCGGGILDLRIPTFFDLGAKLKLN